MWLDCVKPDYQIQNYLEKIKYYKLLFSIITLISSRALSKLQINTQYLSILLIYIFKFYYR